MSAKRDMLPLVTLDACKMRIPGGNGNPVNEGMECECRTPRTCRYGFDEKPREVKRGWFARLIWWWRMRHIRRALRKTVQRD